MKYSSVRVGLSGNYETKDVLTITVPFLHWWYGLFGETVVTVREWEE